mmetsp:Transcript_48422/g.140265  ORF Transcript_48422/g.140265 Transcript_48422/m.140265 type:complete len:105 (-) Transcript_48422:191-505(-)
MLSSTFFATLARCFCQGPLRGVQKVPVESGASWHDAQKVHIDYATEVPIDLYNSLVEAGRHARARGQHAKVQPGGSHGRRSQAQCSTLRRIGASPDPRAVRTEL